MIIHNPILTGSLSLNGTNLSTSNIVTTGSNTFVGNQVVSGSLTVSGSITTNSTLTAQTLVVQTITSSIDFVTGSTRFGSRTSDTHVFTGSMSVTGGLAVNAGNVGIGTTPPANKLTVYGTGDLSYIYNSGVSTTDANFYVYNSTTDILMIRNSGNVGVGMANPSARLHVSGTTGGVFEVDGAAAVNALYVSSSGRVGIGTTNPTAALQVSGSTIISNNQNGLTRLIITNTTAGTNSYVETTLTSDSSAGSGAVGKFSSTTTPYKITTASNTFLYNGSTAGDIAILNDFASGNIKFATGGSSTSQMFISASGNVGIGTTNPSEKLHIYDGTNPLSIKLQRTTVPVYFSDVQTAGTTAGAVWSHNIENTSNGSVSWSGRDNVAYAASAIILNSDTATSYITFHTTSSANLVPTERMRITGDGNVGIGTTNPQGTLHIGGALASSGDAAAINLKQTGTNETTGIYLERSGERKGYAIYVGGSVDSLVFQRNNAGTKSDVMSLTRDGQVGIGTLPSGTWRLFVTSSGDGLFVGSTGAAQTAQFKNFSANNVIVRLENNSGSFYDLQNNISDNSFQIDYNDTARMTITSGGNVLIGPTGVVGSDSKLNVYGTSAGPSFSNDVSGQQSLLLWNKGTSGDNLWVEFHANASLSVRGTIDYNRASNVTRYNTTSDANLKNIIGFSDRKKSIDILSSTKIREYSWKEDATNKIQIGVIAQELYETFKGAVTKGSEQELFGTEDYKNWGVDKTAFTFHLIAGWQEHERIIQELKAEIDILKNK